MSLSVRLRSHLTTLMAVVALVGCIDPDAPSFAQDGGDQGDARVDFAVGAHDAGMADANEAADVGMADAGMADAGMADAGRADAGRADAGPPDAAPPGGCDAPIEGDPCDGFDNDCDGRTDEGPLVDLRTIWLTDSVQSNDTLDVAADRAGAWVVWVGRRGRDVSNRLYLQQVADPPGAAWPITEDDSNAPDQGQITLVHGDPVMAWRALNGVSGDLWLARFSEGRVIYREPAFATVTAPPWDLSLAHAVQDDGVLIGLAFSALNDGQRELMLTEWNGEPEQLPFTTPLTRSMEVEAVPELVGESGALRMTWLERPARDHGEGHGLSLAWKLSAGGLTQASLLENRSGLREAVHARDTDRLAVLRVERGAEGPERAVMDLYAVEPNRSIRVLQTNQVLSAGEAPVREVSILAVDEAWLIAWVEIRNAQGQVPVVLTRVPRELDGPIQQAVVLTENGFQGSPRLFQGPDGVPALVWMSREDGRPLWRLGYRPEVMESLCPTP